MRELARSHPYPALPRGPLVGQEAPEGPEPPETPEGPDPPEAPGPPIGQAPGGPPIGQEAPEGREPPEATEALPLALRDLPSEDPLNLFDGAPPAPLQLAAPKVSPTITKAAARARFTAVKSPPPPPPTPPPPHQPNDAEPEWFTSLPPGEQREILQLFEEMRHAHVHGDPVLFQGEL